MTVASAGRRTVLQEGDEISLLALGSILLRWRRTILALGLLGATVGLARGLLRTPVYKSSARFLPQVAEDAPSGLASVASQFGIRLPSNSGGWGPAVYAELIRSRGLLEPIALDSVVVLEQGARRAAVMDLLEVGAPTSSRRVERTVRALARIVKSSEVKTLGAVEVTVTTRWPSVSLTLAERLIRSVNQFNVETRKSQAAAERQFVEARADEAERALREAEDRLQDFLQRNRAISSPELEFEHDRLRRQVALRQQVYTSLVQNREEARIREVRDTPVITVLEAPRLPVAPEDRQAAFQAVLGGLFGAILGACIAFLSRGVSGARSYASGDAREFFQLVEEVTPRFLKRPG